MLGIGIDLWPDGWRSDDMGLVPYSEFSKPVWFDLMQRMKRPFPQQNVNGYANEEMPASAPVNSVLLTAEVAQAATVFPVTTGRGAEFIAKMAVLIGDNAGDWELNTVASVSGDNVTCNIPARKIWPSGTTRFVPLWGNYAHLSTWGLTWLGNLLANAVVADYDVIGEDRLGAVGDITTFYEYADPVVANVPTGWDLVNAAEIDALVQAGWVSSTVSSASRMGTAKGSQITTKATDTGGTGIQLLAALPVRPGEQYSLSAIVRSINSGGFTLQAYDVTNSAVITETGTATATAINTIQAATVSSRRMALNFTIPATCVSLQIRFITTTHVAAARVGNIDDVRLVPARGPVGVAQYVVPDVRPNPVVTVGDSWGAGALTEPFVTALRTRAPGIAVINRSHAGYNLGDLNALFATEVRPSYPAVVIHYSGFQNDMTDADSQATKEGWVDTFIDNCRGIGARPVFFGCTPHARNPADADAFSAGCDQNDYLRERVLRHVR